MAVDIGTAASVIIVGIIAAVLWAGGLGLLGLQVFWFLQDGAWTDMSIIDALRYVDITPWAAAPNEWLGVYRILEWLSFPACLLVAGYLVLTSMG